LSAYKALLDGQLAEYAALAQTVGSAVAEQVNLLRRLGHASSAMQATAVQAAFQAQYHFLQLASQSKKPSQEVFQTLLGDTQTHLMAAVNQQEAGKGPRKFANQLKMVAEGIPALGWVTIEPKPGPYVKDTREAAEFYSNRVIKEFKDR
jgi:adenylyl cyclase-associated protein